MSPAKLYGSESVSLYSSLPVEVRRGEVQDPYVRLDLSGKDGALQRVRIDASTGSLSLEGRCADLFLELVRRLFDLQP